MARHSTDPHLDAALALDAEYLEAMGQDPGPTLDDLDASLAFFAEFGPVASPQPRSDKEGGE